MVKSDGGDRWLVFIQQVAENTMDAFLIFFYFIQYCVDPQWQRF